LCCAGVGSARRVRAANEWERQRGQSVLRSQHSCPLALFTSGSCDAAATSASGKRSWARSDPSPDAAAACSLCAGATVRSVTRRPNRAGSERYQQALNKNAAFSSSCDGWSSVCSIFHWADARGAQARADRLHWMYPLRPSHARRRRGHRRPQALDSRSSPPQAARSCSMRVPAHACARSRMRASVVRLRRASAQDGLVLFARQGGSTRRQHHCDLRGQPAPKLNGGRALPSRQHGAQRVRPPRPAF